MSERKLLKRLIEREDNEKYITSNYRRLKKDYADMWIAVENQQVWHREAITNLLSGE